MVTLTLAWWAWLGWVLGIAAVGWSLGGALAYQRVSEQQLDALEVLRRPRCAHCGSDDCDTLKSSK